MRAPRSLAALTLCLALPGCDGAEAPVPAGDADLRAALAERATSLDPRALGPPVLGRLLPDLAFTDVAGQSGVLSDLDAHVLVIAIRDATCPVSQKSGPALARLEDELAPRGVRFVFVNPSAGETRATAEREIETFGFDGRYVLDAQQEIARALGARTTCEVFVLDAARTLVYRGALDDQVGRGTALPEARRHFVRDAVLQTLARERVLVSATSAPGCLLGLEPVAPEPAAQITYQREVARILQASCVECHRAGGAAPFSLETYADAQRKKAMIRFVVEEGVMPPWFAAEGTGPWLNDRSLHPEDKQALLDWIASGAPEGDPADAPVPAAWPAGWTIGEPDFVLALEEPFRVPAEGVIDIQYLATDRVIPEDLWISGMQLLPGAPEVVHHVTVSYLPPRGDAFAGELREALLPWGKRPDRWQFLYAYLPGRGVRREPEGVASFLPRGSRVRFEMHYTPKGVATSDLTRLGLLLADEPPELLAESRNVRDYDIAIPPEAADVAFTFDYTLRHDVTLRSLTPHMHLRGAGFQADLFLPDGSARNLLRLAAWDPDWQSSYVFREPPFVPRGSRVRITGRFDNSAANPKNPDPTQWVHDGPQIFDEMLTLVIEWIRPRVAE